MFAFLPTLGFQEMVLLLVLGILLFGRNLPDVGRTLGRTLAQLRRGMQDFKDQMARDESVRELRDSVQKARDEVVRATALPRAVARPETALRGMIDDAVRDADAGSSGGAGPGAQAAEPPHEGDSPPPRA